MASLCKGLSSLSNTNILIECLPCKRLKLYLMLLVDQDTSVEILFPEMLGNTLKYLSANCVCVKLSYSFINR